MKGQAPPNIKRPGGRAIFGKIALERVERRLEQHGSRSPLIHRITVPRDYFSPYAFRQ